MRIVDLTQATSRKAVAESNVPVVVRSVDPTHLIPLDRLVTLATVVALPSPATPGTIERSDLSKIGVADIGGVILHTGWFDRHIAGSSEQSPVLTIDAAAYLLEGGVRTIASDFPISDDAADMLLHNNCVLVHCLTNIGELSKKIVRLVALPLKFEDTFSADARVVAIEE